MLRNLITVIAIIALGSGCSANWTTVDRITPLPGDGESEGVAIHLDAKQRVVYSKKFGAICAEPSPDALSAIATSLGAGVSIADQGSANLTTALTESASSIGLRTQAIQLMRDALYRVCEAYYGRALNSAQLMQLHQRYQDTMLGILAVEQLTGAMVARQVTLGGSANAAAAGQVAQISVLLEQARARETESKAALQKATEERDELSQNVTDKQTEINNAITADASADTTTLTADLNSLSAQLQVAEANLKSATERANEATETREAIENSHGAALSDANAAATSTGSFAPITSPTQLDALSAQAVATAVKEIVEEIVDKDRVFEKCLDAIRDHSTNVQLVGVCKEILLGSEGDNKIKMIVEETKAVVVDTKSAVEETKAIVEETNAIVEKAAESE